MTERSIFANLARDADDIVSAVHGPFLLQSALQPILRESCEGVLELEAVEGRLRASRNGVAVAPADFFALVEEQDRPMVDSLCRTLHILNAGALDRKDVTLLVNARPGVFDSPCLVRQEVDRMRLAAHEAGLPPERIACELSERPGEDANLPALLATQLHEANFLVAIDEYSSTDDDLERLLRLRPDFLKFDPIWVQRFAESTAGVALMRVIVAQLEREGIRPIVPGIEESSQVELCRQIGMPLMQGYLLGLPEVAPTSLNLDFPEVRARRSADSAQATPADAIRAVQSAPRLGKPVTRTERTTTRFGRRSV